MIPESAILAQIAAHRGWGYAPTVAGVRDCRYPTPIPGPVHTNRPPPYQTDCVCYAISVVLGACYATGILVDWTQDRHELALIATEEQAFALRRAREGDEAHADLLFGPVIAMVAAGLAERVTTDEPALGWFVFQGWTADWKRGHCFLGQAQLHAEVTVHECAEGFGGVRQRTRDPEAIRKSFHHLRAARLLVSTDKRKEA